MLRSYHLPPPNPTEDQPAVNLPTKEQPAPAVHTKEPQIPASSVTAPAFNAPLPIAPASFVPLEPSTPRTTVHTNFGGPSTTAPPQQHISISTQDFLAIMDAVRTFSVTSASFVVAHAALAERMIRTEVAVAQTKAILTQNQAIIVQIQSYLGLPPISPSVPAQASSIHPLLVPAPFA